MGRATAAAKGAGDQSRINCSNQPRCLGRPRPRPLPYCLLRDPLSCRPLPFLSFCATAISYCETAVVAAGRTIAPLNFCPLDE